MVTPRQAILLRTAAIAPVAALVAAAVVLGTVGEPPAPALTLLGYGGVLVVYVWADIVLRRQGEVTLPIESPSVTPSSRPRRKSR